jgi:hypothetical protein
VSGTGVWEKSPSTGAPPTLALWLVNADGTNPRKIQDLLPPRTVDLTPGGDDAFNLLPALTALQELAWSPDGRLVAFVSAHENQVDVYTAALDGTIARISNTAELEQGPRWSPDGTLLAYKVTKGFGTGAGWNGAGLAVTPRAGGAPTRQFDAFALKDGQPASFIDSVQWVAPGAVALNLSAPPAEGGEVQIAAIGDGAITSLVSAPGIDLLSWSSAAQTLAIGGAHVPGLFVWRPGAPAATDISGGPAQSIAWSALGDGLAFAGAGGRNSGITIWSIGTDGDLHQISSAPARRLLWSPDGQRIAADGAIYDRAGKKLADLPSAAALPIGWIERGLFVFAGDGTQPGAFWFWDGAQVRRVAEATQQPDGARVVLPQ